MTARPLNYPPPWMDIATLCAHVCLSPNGVDAWVAQGILPPPVKRGGKLMWEWKEVDEKLRNGGAGKSPDAQAERMRHASRRAATENRTGH